MAKPLTVLGVDVGTTATKMAVYRAKSGSASIGDELDPFRSFPRRIRSATIMMVYLEISSRRNGFVHFMQGAKLFQIIFLKLMQWLFQERLQG